MDCSDNIDCDTNLSDLDKLVEAEIELVKKLKTEFSEDEFLRIVALVFVQSKQLGEQLSEYEKMINEYSLVMRVCAGNMRENSQQVSTGLLELMAEADMVAAKALLKGIGLSRRSMAIKGARAKLLVDPKQAAKSSVKECWDDWQKMPNRYKNKSAFAKDMMSKFERLDNQVVITRWCSQWEKEESQHSAS